MEPDCDIFAIDKRGFAKRKSFFHKEKVDQSKA
jgi:hypothetical protein